MSDAVAIALIVALFNAMCVLGARYMSHLETRNLTKKVERIEKAVNGDRKEHPY